MSTTLPSILLVLFLLGSATAHGCPVAGSDGSMQGCSEHPLCDPDRRSANAQHHVPDQGAMPSDAAEDHCPSCFDNDMTSCPDIWNVFIRIGKYRAPESAIILSSLSYPIYKPPQH